MVAAVEPGGIPDTTLLAEQQKLQLLAVCTEKAFQDNSSYRQHYLCILEDYWGQYLEQEGQRLLNQDEKSSTHLNYLLETNLPNPEQVTDFYLIP